MDDSSAVIAAGRLATAAFDVSISVAIVAWTKIGTIAGEYHLADETLTFVRLAVRSLFCATRRNTSAFIIFNDCFGLFSFEV